MKKTYYDWSKAEDLVQDILQQIQVDKWHPQFVVGLARGGLLPAVMISHYLDIPMYSLKVSLRDNSSNDHNESCHWMARAACGLDSGTPTNILIIDDINDSGNTIKWIKNDWKRAEPTNYWPRIWDTLDGNVRIAVLVNNTVSESTVSYSSVNINKNEEDQWIVFPWENWWAKL